MSECCEWPWARSPKGYGVDLSGPDGNAFVLLGMARTWSRQLGKDGKAITAEMMSGDYQELLEVFRREFGTVCTLVNAPGEK